MPGERGAVSDLTPAQELREAARLMKERAKVATPGPWRYDPGKHFRAPGTCSFEESVFVGPIGKEALSVARTGETDDPESMADAAYIASMHPGVAVAVAGWLDDEAAGYEAYDAETQAFRAGDRDGDLDPAVTTARVYLGAGEGQ